MGQGVIPLREMTELAQLRWFGHSVRIGDERYLQTAWQARPQERKTPRDLGMNG